MNLFGVMGISASGLSAERTRAEVVAGNMANAESTHTAAGGPYQRQEVVFQSEAPSSFRMQLASAGGALSSGMAGGVAVRSIVSDRRRRPCAMNRRIPTPTPTALSPTPALIPCWR